MNRFLCVLCVFLVLAASLPVSACGVAVGSFAPSFAVAQVQSFAPAAVSCPQAVAVQQAVAVPQAVGVSCGQQFAAVQPFAVASPFSVSQFASFAVATPFVAVASPFVELVRVHRARFHAFPLNARRFGLKHVR